MYRYWMMLRIYLRSMFSRARWFYRLPSANHLWESPEVPDYPESSMASFLRWVNRNQLLMRLIDCQHRYVLAVNMQESRIRVNGYLAIDDSRATLARCQRDKGTYLFYQKDWEDAIGAKYAPFMTPVSEDKEPVYYDPARPVFSMEFPLPTLRVGE